MKFEIDDIVILNEKFISRFGKTHPWLGRTYRVVGFSGKSTIKAKPLVKRQTDGENGGNRPMQPEWLEKLDQA